MKHFEMPETHDCKCREGLTYDKESQVCIDCVKAQATIQKLVDTALSAGNPEVSAALLFMLLSKTIDEKKEDN